MYSKRSRGYGAGELVACFIFSFSFGIATGVSVLLLANL